MRKKILCAIMSAVMIVGSLTGCGSSSGSDENTSKDTESTIFTELIPGVSANIDVKSFVEEHDLAYQKGEDVFSTEAEETQMYIVSKNSADVFLGYETYYSKLQWTDDYKAKCDGYKLLIYFKDISDFKEGSKKIKSYLKGLSYDSLYDEEFDDTKYYVKDNKGNKYEILFDNSTCDWDGYYKETVMLDCNIRTETLSGESTESTETTESIKREDSTESTETTESIKREDSTESTYREDSTEASQQDNSNLTAEKQAYDVEEEVNKIRDIYYWVQGDSSNLTKQDGGSVTRWIDSNGKIRKIVAPAGTYDDTNGADAAKYNAEFYYNENEELVFVFLYSGKEEHRLYVVQGKCVRYIDQDRSVNDYPELKEADSVCGLGYFIGLGMMEIHYAYV